MYRVIPKRRIRRIEDNSEDERFLIIRYMLELCRESDDELWHELIETYREDSQILKELNKSNRRF